MQFKDEDEIVSFAKKAKLPDWQAKLFSKLSDAIQVHSQGHIFYKIDRLFPNEHPESKKHRVLAFESITEASFSKAANNINRIFKNSSYTIEASDKTLEFAKEHDFEGNNLFGWFLDEWVKWALKEDPNSRIAVYPPEYSTEKKPTVTFIPSEFIRHIDEETVIFVSPTESKFAYSLEETKVVQETFYDQSVMKWNARDCVENTFTPKLKAEIKEEVYHVFQKGQGFFRIERDPLDPKGQTYIVDTYKIKADFLPVIDVGGEKGQQDVNKSFLHPFVAFGNLALLQHSQHTAVNFSFSFPRMSEIEKPCEAPGCQEGYVYCEEPADIAKYGEKKICIACGGSGGTTTQSPYKIYKKRYDPQGVGGAEDRYLTVPEVQFYTPDTAILDYSKSEWKEYLEMAEQSVYVNQKIQTGNVESAKSKEIDRDDLYSFLSRVAQIYFARLRFVLQAIENYFVSNATQVVVNTPYSYAIVSETEAFAALKDIVSSNVPILLKANQVESFINKFISQSSPLRKFLDVLKLVDPLLYYTNGDIQAFKASDVISGDHFAIHVFAFPILQQLWFRDKNLFIEKEPEVIADLLIKEIDKHKPKQPAGLKERLINEGFRPPGWKKPTE